ncbi:MAG: hypothetical protein V4457_06005 [Pseudomonadota bacterium]
MAYPKGKPRPAKSGRRKGTPNKVTGDLREMILGALAGAGGEDYLRRQAKANPSAFMALIGRTLPKDIKLGGGLKLEVNLVGVDRSAHG